MNGWQLTPPTYLEGASIVTKQEYLKPCRRDWDVVREFGMMLRAQFSKGR